LKFQQKRIGRGTAKAKELIGRSLINNRCSRCHTLDRVYRARKFSQEWILTLNRMIKYANDPNFLSNAEKEEALKFLAAR